MQFNEETIKKIVFDSLYPAFEKSIKEGWRNGIDEIVKEVISENRDTIKEKYDKALKTALAGKHFEKAITDEFQHKVAKNMVAKLEGQVEQAVNVLRQDQTLRAKMVVAIEQIINKHSQ
jgi:hypothetical protein